MRGGRGVGKICDFQPISRRISETVQDREKVSLLLITDRKFYMPFQLVPKSTTSLWKFERRQTNSTSSENVAQGFTFKPYKIHADIRGVSW